MGAGWGATQPLTKIAVSTGHGHFGLIFWQLVIVVLVLGTVQLVRRRGLSFSNPQIWFYLVIVLLGTILPNTASYIAIAHLPAGLMSIFISLVPMLAFPLALILGIERFEMRRLLGLALGLVAVILIVGVRDALPDRSMLVFVPLAVFAPLMYAMEGSFVGKWGTGGAGPLQLLLGASIIGVVIAFPLAVGTGQFISPLRPWGAPEWAFVASSVIHAIVYTSFVAAIRKFGPVFAEQVAYLVAAFGLFWAILMLGERYSGPIWLAVGLMFVGIYLVQPKSGEEHGPSTD